MKKINEDVISKKDLLNITDIYNWNHSAILELNIFLDNVNDTKTKNIIKEVITIHYKNLEKCINILNHQHDDLTMED